MQSRLQRTYDQVEVALWASLVACLIFFAVYVLPHVPEHREYQQALTSQELERENAYYCKRWNFVPSTREYDLCMSDLQTFRRAVVARFERDLDVTP